MKKVGCSGDSSGDLGDAENERFESSDRKNSERSNLMLKMESFSDKERNQSNKEIDCCAESQQSTNRKIISKKSIILYLAYSAFFKFTVLEGTFFSTRSAAAANKGGKMQSSAILSAKVDKSRSGYRLRMPSALE